MSTGQPLPLLTIIFHISSGLKTFHPSAFLLTSSVGRRHWVTRLKLIVCLSTLQPSPLCKTNDVFLFYLILVDLGRNEHRGYCLACGWGVQCVLIHQTSNIDRWNINEDQFDRMSVIHHLAGASPAHRVRRARETILNNTQHSRNFRL